MNVINKQTTKSLPVCRECGKLRVKVECPNSMTTCMAGWQVWSRGRVGKGEG